MDNLDPQNPPVGGTDGQPVEPVEPTEPPTPEVDPVEARLATLEKQNKDLQHKLTQQGRERKRQESTTQPASTPAEEFDWNDPGASIKGSVRQEFADFEARQDQRRQADEMKRQVVQEYGIPEEKYDAYYRQLEEAAASGDPMELHRTVARMYQAENAEEAISEARRTATESVERNARGVTSTGQATQPTPEEKPMSEMTDKEADDFVMRKYGKAEWPT